MHSSPAVEPHHSRGEPAVATAWTALLAATRLTRGELPVASGLYGADGAGGLRRVSPGGAEALLVWRAGSGWAPAPDLSSPVRDLVELYLPLCNACATQPITVGHLGQSLDGHIATDTGDSCYVTGRENIVHLHRMRALCDAVIVGAGTIVADDPRLTTRLVPGDDPLRVVLAPQGRLSGRYRVFTDDKSPTLLICAEEQRSNLHPGSVGKAEVMEIPGRDGRLELDAVLRGLHQRSCHVIFVEGGGTTVSRFLEADLLDRLQVAVAPLLIGSGRPGIRLPPTTRLRDCLKPAHHIYRMGDDVLFDCDLRAARGKPGALPSGRPGLARIR
jgi:diaminohydroxyphosphoribosylaminopyrimidine deaminase/5-amino-6-(5-phosphoribosylamino)uracil reductase